MHHGEISDVKTGDDVRHDDDVVIDDEDDFRLGAQQRLARNKESRRVRRFSRHRTNSVEAVDSLTVELDQGRLQSPGSPRRSRLHQLSGGHRPGSPVSFAEAAEPSAIPEKETCNLALLRSASRSASRHRQRQSYSHLSPVRGKTVATVEWQRMGGIQRSFTQVLRESSDKRAAVSRPTGDHSEQSIVSKILQEIGVRQLSLPQDEETNGRSEPKSNRQSWYQKAASKMGIKTTAEAPENTCMSKNQADEAPLVAAVKSPQLTKDLSTAELEKSMQNAGLETEMAGTVTTRAFGCRERTESVCSDNLPDLSLVQEDKQDEAIPAVERLPSPVLDNAEAVPSLGSECTFPEELQGGGLFLTSFDHDDDDEYEEVNEEKVEEDHEVTSGANDPMGQPAGAQVQGTPLLTRRLLLQNQVSQLLSAVLRPIAEPAGGQQPELSWSNVEQILCQRISEVIDKTLTEDGETDPLAERMLLPSADLVFDHEVEALVRVDKSDCESCGDLSEQENVYDVFDLREEPALSLYSGICSLKLTYKLKGRLLILYEQCREHFDPYFFGQSILSRPLISPRKTQK